MARTPRRPLAVAALLLDVVAVGLLVADVVAAYRVAVAPVLLLSALGIPFAVAGAITSGVHLTRRLPGFPRWAAIPLVVVVTVATVPIGATLLAVAYSATPNPAATDESSLGRTAEAAGGRRLCGHGDPGLGPDNTQPYFSTVYEVPAGTELTSRLTAQAQRLGWTVSSDSDDDPTRTTPRVQLDEGATTVTGACGVYGDTVRAAAGTHLVEIEVLLPYRR